MRVHVPVDESGKQKREILFVLELVIRDQIPDHIPVAEQTVHPQHEPVVRTALILMQQGFAAHAACMLTPQADLLV
jgi:hypothetical protein